mmetsp:Transcript_19185/g.31403  ORF Transcript_19185/g.31403 Transcript_19185/m.31403 type:complete len:356 (-) Transcript_19185:180-1247(-)
MSLSFLDSTQYRNWTFTAEEIREKRTAASDAAFNVLRSFILSQRKDGPATESTVTLLSVENHSAMLISPAPTQLHPAVSPSPMLISPAQPRPSPAMSSQLDGLSEVETLALLKFHELKIREVCSVFKFPDIVHATAIVYFKRFYLSRSIIDYHPKQVMLTSIYIACKVEEINMPVDDFVRPLNADPDQILQFELVFLDSIHFQLIVFHPYRPLLGLIQEAEELGLYTQIKELYESARKIVHTSLFTDLSLIFSPAQIAAAALKLAAVRLSLDISPLFEKVFAEHKDYEKFLESLDTNIIPVLEVGENPPDHVMCQEADKKLKKYKKIASDMNKQGKVRKGGSDKKEKESKHQRIK